MRTLEMRRQFGGLDGLVRHELLVQGLDVDQSRFPVLRARVGVHRSSRAPTIVPHRARLGQGARRSSRICAIRHTCPRIGCILTRAHFLNAIDALRGVRASNTAGILATCTMLRAYYARSSERHHTDDWQTLLEGLLPRRKDGDGLSSGT